MTDIGRKFAYRKGLHVTYGINCNSKVDSTVYHNYKFCSLMPSTQLFIVGPNSKVRADVLRIDIMLSGEMGHQNQVIVCNLSSAFPYGASSHGGKGEGQGQMINDKSSPV